MRLPLPLASSLLVVAAMMGAARSGAQESVPADSAAAPRTHHWLSSASFFELRLVAAHHSPVPTRMPTSAYRDLYIVDLRAGWTIASSQDGGGLVSVEYAPSIVPLAISTRNPEYARHAVAVKCDPPAEHCATAYDWETVPSYHNAYGFGFSPVGFQLRLFGHSPVQLLAHANGGVLWFTHPLPDPAATRFNFTAELGAAIQIPLPLPLSLPNRYGLIVGYVWHHTSNAGTGNVNPGLNSRAFTFGVVANRRH